MNDHAGTPKNNRWKQILKISAAAILAAAAIALLRYFRINELLLDVLNRINELGIAGMSVYAAAYIAATVLFIPGSVLTLGAGFLYGLLWGTILVSLSSTAGASLAFIIGRYLARDWVSRKIAGNEKFKAIDDAVGREGWKIVFLCRLSPVFPFILLNYAFGLTRVKFSHYLLASWIGMAPGTIMYVYIGSLASDISTLGTGHARTPFEWALYIVGFCATAVVTVFITRLARKSLKSVIEKDA